MFNLRKLTLKHANTELAVAECPQRRQFHININYRLVNFLQRPSLNVIKKLSSESMFYSTFGYAQLAALINASCSQIVAAVGGREGRDQRWRKRVEDGFEGGKEISFLGVR